MSARARDWAYSVQLPLCQKFVLVALAERANEEGVAWPSARTISDMTGACDKAVRNALKQLEQGGFIARISSGTRSKTYRLCIELRNEIPVSVTGQTGMTYRQTVNNRQEPIHNAPPEGDDWVSSNWMKIGNDVLAIAGHNPASAMAPTGIVRQWLADARAVGYSLTSARDVILETVRQRCERGSGTGKAPAWFDKPVRSAITSGCTAASAPELPVDSRAIQDAYRDHVVWCSNHREKRQPFEQFEAEWRERHAA